MDWRKEIRETFIYIAVGLLMAYAINTGLGYALDTDKPVMAVVSNSMDPTIKKGDLVVVKGIPPGDIAVGDIIVYHNPLQGVAVVHRVIDIRSDEDGLVFYTKGDNNRTNRLSDQDAGIAPPIREYWIKGKVVVTIPKLGWPRVILTMVL